MSDDIRASAESETPLPADFDGICVSNLLDTAGTILFVKDRESRFIKVSIDCARLNRRTQAEMVGLTDFDLTDRAHALELMADERRIMETGEPIIDKEEIDRMADRPGTWVETSKFPLRDADGAIIGTFGYSRDVSRWEVAERELERMADALAAANEQLVQAEAQLRAVLNGSPDAIARYDRHLRYRYLNPTGERLKGATLEEVRGRTDRETGMPDVWVEEYEAAMRAVLETGRSGDIEFAGERTAAGDRQWLHLTLSPDRDAADAVIGVLATIRDITQIKRAEQAQAHRALHDPLTGLANRLLLMDRLGKALVRLHRNPGRVGLVYVDLDHFKDVNDTYGHEVGDRVLVDVARLLVQVARREDTVARLGGDEFVVLCDSALPGDVESIAARIVKVLAEPFDDGGASFRRSASVGATSTTDPGASASGLLHAADSAMYRAKLAGRNSFEVVDSV